MLTKKVITQNHKAWGDQTTCPSDPHKTPIRIDKYPATNLTIIILTRVYLGLIVDSGTCTKNIFVMTNIVSTDIDVHNGNFNVFERALRASFSEILHINRLF